MTCWMTARPEAEGALSSKGRVGGRSPSKTLRQASVAAAVADRL